MSRSSRPDHFFQSDSVLDTESRKARKSHNLRGDPIRLPSKLLAVHPDPDNDGAVYVCESAAVVKRVVLATGQTTRIFKGPQAPLSCLCLSGDGKKVYAGCWDKSIWSWHVSTSAPDRRLQGHTDFVKSLLYHRAPDGRDLLVSGGAEGHILIWHMSSGDRLAVVKCNNRAVQDIALDPFHPETRLFAAFSNPDIISLTISDFDPLLRDWSLSQPITTHHTSVHKLLFDSDGDLWTASADRTAKHLVRQDGWTPDTTLVHPDFVRDVVVHERYGWAITACRDEEIRVWDIATGELYHTFSGHFEDVTALCLISDRLVSISIDGTIRQWSLNPRDLQRSREVARDPKKADEEVEANPSKKVNDPSALTEEEEAELAELMEDEEQDPPKAKSSSS